MAELQEKVEKSAKGSNTASPEEASRVGSVMQKTIEADPVLQNEMNQEPWWQSGVGVFGSGGVLSQLGIVLVQVGTHGTDFQSYDFETVGTAMLALAMFAMVLYRRFKPGLKPMFHSFRKKT